LDLLQLDITLQQALTSPLSPQPPAHKIETPTPSSLSFPHSPPISISTAPQLDTLEQELFGTDNLQYPEQPASTYTYTQTNTLQTPTAPSSSPNMPPTLETPPIYSPISTNSQRIQNCFLTFLFRPALIFFFILSYMIDYFLVHAEIQSTTAAAPLDALMDLVRRLTTVAPHETHGQVVTELRAVKQTIEQFLAHVQYSRVRDISGAVCDRIGEEEGGSRYLNSN
jgi:hypothetical protein